MHRNDVLLGAALGAAATYLLDPAAGRRRRALARDKVTRVTRKTRDAMDATARDVSNRTRGVLAATRGRLSRGHVSDDILVERVRAKLGRASSHPRAIDVEARNGIVTLRGPILSSEVDRVLGATAAVRGVHDLVNQLEPHASADGIPALQGEGSVAGPNLDILQRNWSPATQALVAVAGLATGVCVAAYARR